MKHPRKLQNRPAALAAGGPFQGGIRHMLARFGRDESGSLVVLGLILTVLMVMMGGLAVDLIRYEERRATLQSTIDRSVLAAASLSQKRDPQAVVEDYLGKAGLDQYLTGVTVDSGLNYRDVQASARAHVVPYFMKLIGINNLSAPVASRAEQRISNVEVSMVLDVSGSMNGSRIRNLRPAAKEFIDSVLASSDPGRVSISVVPYNAQVNIGPQMLALFNASARHSYSYCLELPDDTFSTTELSLTRPLVQNGHFDPFSSGRYNYNYNCNPSTNTQVLAISDSATQLHNRIDAMQVGGNTSIDVGVKWGALLLDPSAQTLVAGLSAAGAVSPTYIGRPLNPVTADVMKVLVVMTDGENTTEYKVNSPYNDGLSNIYRRNSNGDLSAYFEDEGEGGGQWVTTGKKKKKKKVWVEGPRKDYYSVDDDEWNETPDGGFNGSTRLTWHEVWANYPIWYIANTIYSEALDGSASTWFWRFADSVYSTKNSRLQTICNAAKNAGIIVYGIGFEAPYNGREQVRQCATSPAHYFDASGLEITTAFRAIASNISQLRLTQ